MATPWRRVSSPATILTLLLIPGHAAAQSGTVAVEQENLRAIPRGVVIAELVSGAPLRLGERQDRWREATLEAWIWAASVRAERRGGYDLVVSASAGENLRASPNGTVVGRARNGMRLQRVETDGNWVSVRRTAWIWEPSLRVERPAPTRPTTATTAAAAVTPDREDAPAAGRTARSFLPVGPAGLVVVSQPGGDTLGRVHGDRTVEVLAREGDWVRIRVDGWASAAALGPADTAAGGVLREVGRTELSEDPDRFRGRLVEWSVQFIALQQAERFRTDFLEGETFILARGPGDDPGFVYVAIPPDRLEEVQNLTPLQRIRILGRIRSASSALTQAPVVDLLEITARGSPRR